MNILFLLMWMNHCCIHWLQSSRAGNHKNVLNQNIQAAQNNSGKQKLQAFAIMLDGFFEEMQMSTQTIQMLLNYNYFLLLKH